jgi:periplasmic protein TonB
VSFPHEAAHALRAHNVPDPGDRRLWAALAVSVLLHALLVLAMSGHSLPEVPVPPPPLIARLTSPPPPEAPASRRDEAPPPLIKNTIEPPRPEVLDDPIKPQPKKRITEKPEPQPPAPRPPVAAAKAPEPAPVRPPVVDTPAPPATAREERKPLDLSVPQDTRARGAERLSQQELAETMTRLSETMLYPSEALKRGLEGEVVIIVELGAGGRIIDAGIASGSGHAVLDEAAVRAVLKLGTLGNSSANRTILLPVRFRIL